MALSESVQESLNEASASLRNALAFAARGERDVVQSLRDTSGITLHQEKFRKVAQTDPYLLGP